MSENEKKYLTRIFPLIAMPDLSRWKVRYSVSILLKFNLNSNNFNFNYHFFIRI